MAASDMNATDSHYASSSAGAGPHNVNEGRGQQINNTISGGSHNAQYNADVQNFHGTGPPTPSQLATQIRTAIFLTDPTTDRDKLIETKGERAAGTCEWIMKHYTFMKWRREDKQSLLWIWGSPGKGKTVLSIFLSQELETETKTIFYFCRAEDEKRNTATGVLRGLVWHLLVKFPELVECVPAILDLIKSQRVELDLTNSKEMEVALSSREMLWSVFTRLVDELKPDRAYCVLDGLDECDEDSQHWLTRKLVSFSNNVAESKFKLVVVSRELSELRDSEQMRLDFDHSKEVSFDVKSFVQAKSLELTKRVTSQSKFREEVGNEFRERIEDTLLERSQGSFLWVGFAMIELIKEETITGVLATLDDIPKGLYAVYERMLGKIRSNQRDSSLQILGWVALARRPLSLQEFASAVSCQPTIDSLSTEDAILERVITCGPLLHVVEQTVTLVHESARDYLLLEVDSKVTTSKGLHVEQEEVHLRIAQACVDALSRSCPLSNYAEQHWPHHARQSKELATGLVSNASSFFANHSFVRNRWWQGHWKDSDRDYRNSGICLDMPQLHMACSFGINPWVNKILRGHAKSARFHLTNQCNKRNNKGATPLQLAVAAGYENTVELLLESGATIGGINNHGDSACSLAARHGQDAILKLLLNNGIHPDVDLGCSTELRGFLKEGFFVARN